MSYANLTPQTATLGLAIGLVLALICYLTTNLSPGGMITPGWLALVLVLDYRQALIIVGVTAATYGLILLLRRLIILYGKRLFAAVVLLGVLMQMSIFVFIQQDYPFLFTHQTLGFIVPGLLAYQLVRQRLASTLLATGVVTAATYAVMISGVLVGVMPTT
jgi:poly-gamma-glutamate biosynthesis protein PgsC/CapC